MLLDFPVKQPNSIESLHSQNMHKAWPTILHSNLLAAMEHVGSYLFLLKPTHPIPLLGHITTGAPTAYQELHVKCFHLLSSGYPIIPPQPQDAVHAFLAWLHQHWWQTTGLICKSKQIYLQPNTTGMQHWWNKLPAATAHGRRQSSSSQQSYVLVCWQGGQRRHALAVGCWRPTKQGMLAGEVGYSGAGQGGDKGGSGLRRGYVWW